MAKHVHAELIKAWADGAQIEVWDKSAEVWREVKSPSWRTNRVYGFKPENVVVYVPVFRRNMDGEVFLGTPTSDKLGDIGLTYHTLTGSIRLEVSEDGKHLISATMES